MTDEAHSGDLRNSQLFLDDRLIDDHVRVQRVWHQPQKYPKPVMEGKYPWEGGLPLPVWDSAARGRQVPHVVRGNPQLVEAARLLRGER